LSSSLTRWSWQATKRTLTWLVLIATFIRLAFAFSRVNVPFELDYEEGNVLNAALRILHGQTPYPDPASFPYTLNPYGPVGYATAAIGTKLFGVSLFGPRLLVLVAGIATMAIIALLIAKLSDDWQVGILFAGVFVCSPLVKLWLPLLRVDFFAIFWSVLGLYIFLEKPRLSWMAAVAFSLAFLTKPTAIAAPLACVLDLILRKRILSAVGFAAIYLSIISAGAFGLGKNFIFDLTRTHPDPYSLKRALALYFVALTSAQLTLAVLVYGLAFGFRWTNKSRALGFYFAASSLAALSGGKLGSETNHFLEWTAALCIVGGLATAFLLAAHKPLGHAFFIGLAALTMWFALVPRYALLSEASPGGCLEAYNFLRSYSGDRILSEDVASLVLTDKPVLVSNPFVATQLGDSVAWSRGSMTALASRQYFQLIIQGAEVQGFQPSSGRWPPAFISAVGQHYRVQQRFLCAPHFVVAYAPK
jgi:4-amino-4-deoxy-L-arabinose transferase-like glycosyltransferase